MTNTEGTDYYRTPYRAPESRFGDAGSTSQTGARGQLSENAEAYAALVALLEPLDRWISVTRGDRHRYELVLAYARSVPADARLVLHLCGCGPSISPSSEVRTDVSDLAA